MVARRLVPAAALVLAVVPFAAFVAMGGCSDGKTPDCSSPDSGCGPNTDGAIFGDGEAGAPGDSGSDVNKGDASPDAPPDEAGPDGAAD